MTTLPDPQQIAVGVVGLGLMGRSIIVTMLLSGHRVKAIAPLESEVDAAVVKIDELLLHCGELGLLVHPQGYYRSRLEISTDFSMLRSCSVAIECVIEVLAIKQEILRKIDRNVPPRAVIGSNTSAIPISLLQKEVSNPGRFLGIHWAEPAYLTRFLEIICGDESDPVYADFIYRLAAFWKKEPTLLRKDIPGFITNRLMYAVYREAFTLTEQGYTTLEDADKAFRYDAGSWITLMGIFRRMDYLGLKEFGELGLLFESLSNRTDVPAVMEEMVTTNARGIVNARGLYPYTKEEAVAWEKAFGSFNEEIFDLAAQYPIPAPVLSNCSGK